jgi:Ca-activated chloride channel family protein
MGGLQDYYVMLGARRGATQEEIRRAYLKSVQRLHPDKNVNPGETEMFLDVQQAYEVLGDPQRRAKYDATLPPEPEPPPAPIHASFEYSRASLLRMPDPQVVYALLDFAPAAELADNPSPPLNLCLVLDVSTSMQGPKLEMVKETAIQILRRLRPQDTFSLVTFSDRAQVHIPASRGADARRAESKVYMLQTSGGTEIFHGLEAGVQQTRRSLSPASINHVILLTDGQTYGDELSCLELAGAASAEGIGISGLGVGSAWNDIFLDSLAGRAGGSCLYVSDPQDIPRLLIGRFEQLGEVFASDASLEFKLGENIALSYAFRLQPDPAPLGVESPLVMGAILYHTRLQVLLDFQMPALEQRDEEVVLLDGRLTAVLPADAQAAPALPIVIQRPLTDEPDPAPPPPALIRAMSRVTLYRMQERARAEVKGGEFDKATQRLKRLATNLLSQGEQGLARTVLLEVEHIEREKSFSESGEKDIKFGTRALILPEQPDDSLPTM